MTLVDDLLTARQVASWLAVTEGALAQRRHRGGGPPYLKWGRSIRYVKADVEDWIATLRRSET